MIKAKLIENAYDHAADLVAARAVKSDRLDEQVQRLFVVTRVERSEGRPEIRHPASFEPDSSRQAVGRKASMDLSKDIECLFVLPAAVQNPGELDRSFGVPGLELQGRAERSLIALASQQFCFRWEEGVEKALHRVCRLSADELGDDSPFVESLDRGNALNPVRPRNRRVGVDIELHEVQSVFTLRSLALQDGAELTARAAPFGPEVDDNRDSVRALENRRIEIALSYVHETRLPSARLSRGRKGWRLAAN